MFNTFSRTFMLLIVLIFGGITAAHASTIDANQSTQGESQWNKQTNVYYYMKTFFMNWDNHWQSVKQDKQSHKYQSTPKPSKENNEQTKQTEKVNKQEQEKQPTKQANKPKQEEKAEVETNQPSVEEPAQQSESTDALNTFEQQVFDLTNEERVNAGLAALQIDQELSRVAREKSRDMAINNYFNHNSPVYGSPFDMIRAYGINYRTAGENIAKGQRTPQEVVNAWMNSPGHRANIMNGSFTHIGVGFVEQGNHWTQMFIGK